MPQPLKYSLVKLLGREGFLFGAVLRKALSKKIRFEVFKRDSFTCQYCGNSPPKCVLNVDHVIPVAKGGSNDILNLITSCFDCNSGKKDILLSSSVAIEKRMNQATIEQEMINQKKMMAQWIASMSKAKDIEFNAYKKYLLDIADVNLSDYGIVYYKKLLSKYGLRELFEATKISFENYYDSKDKKEFLDKIERICIVRERDRKDPEGAQIRKIVAMNYKRFDKQFWQIEKDINQLLSNGFELEEIAKKIKYANTYYQFISAMGE